MINSIRHGHESDDNGNINRIGYDQENNRNQINKLTLTLVFSEPKPQPLQRGTLIDFRGMVR